MRDAARGTTTAVACPSCDRTLPPDVPRGPCPACLRETSRAEGPGSDHSGGPAFPSLMDAPAPAALSFQPSAVEALTTEVDPAGPGPGWVGPGDIPSTVDFDRGPRPSGRPPPSIPGYAIGELLGFGGMGVVYRAEQDRLKRAVALKMIRADAHVSGGQLERFRVEAEAVARLRHPHVVQIYEIGEAGGVPYFSMELLEGGRLAERLSRSPLPIRAAAELAATLAGAVHAAHRVGIVHRDLKPGNVLFDADGVAKVADFGLAKRLEADDGQTLTGQVMGTPSYMAPEQARGLNREVGPAADVYALGALLYEMIAGRPPFKGSNSSDTLLQVVSQDPVPPSRLQPKLPRDLETICLKCLAKEPSRRYASAEGLALDLGRFLDGKSIHARPTPFWERAAKVVRRRPLTSTLAAVALMTALGLGLSLARDLAAEHEHRRVLVGRQREALQSLALGLGQLERGDLDEARVTLSNLAASLADEPVLADLRRGARKGLDDVERRRQRADAQARAVARLGRFRDLRDEALRLDGVSALDPDSGEPPRGAAEEAFFRQAGSPKQVRAAARKALAVFGPGEAPHEGATAEERAEVASGVLLMRLVESEATARPGPGEDPGAQAREALRLLDGAAIPLARSPAFHLRRAACLDRLGDPDAAAKERAEAETLAPADAFDRLLLGRERCRRGQWDEASRHLEAALRERPDSFWARYWLAMAELNGSPPRVAEAKTDLTTCLLQQPGAAWLYLHRGYAYGQMAVSFAAAARPGDAGASLREKADGLFEDAEADFREARRLGLDADLSYRLWMARGVVRHQRGRPADALADFDAAIEADPARYNAFASRAQALRRLGRRDEAVEALTRAIALRPGLADLYRGRALARLDGPDDPQAEAALRDLEESARLEVAEPRAAAADHARRARLLLKLGRNDAALEAAGAALAIAPDQAEAHGARVAGLLEQGRFDAMLDACNAALAAGPATAELHRLRGVAREGRGDFPGAIEDFTEALALRREGWPEVRRGRGWAYLLADAPELAARDFEAVIRLAPGEPDGLAGRAAARVRLGRAREAVADAEASLRVGEPSGRILYNAARTLSQAAALAAAEAPRRGVPAARESIAYAARGTALLRRAFEQVPAGRRHGFWADTVSADPALRPLLRNPSLARSIGVASPPP